MQDTSKTDQDRISGDIFSADTPSAYEEAASVSPEIENLRQAFQDESSSSTPERNGADSVAFDGHNEGFPPQTSPPFTENKFKKFLILLFILFFIFSLMFLVYKLIIGRKPKPDDTSKQVTLTYWGLWEQEEIMKSLIDDYQKTHPQVKVNYLRSDHKQYRERLQSAIDRGEGPDIFRFHNTWVPMFINYLSPLPKNIFSNDEFMSIFYPVAVYDLKVGDNLYGIPLMIDGLLLYYNEDILKSANVAVPATWKEVQDAIPKLTVIEKGRIVTSAIALGTAENVEHFSDILTLMMLQNGTQLTKSLFSCTTEGFSNCAVEALTFYRKFSEDPGKTWDDTLENSIIAFAGSKTAMIIAPSWQALTINGMNPNLNFKTAPVPQLPCSGEPCSSVNYATYWVEGVSARGKNPDQAWEFLKFLSSEESMQKLYSEQMKVNKLFGEPYSRMDMGKLLSDNPYLAPLITEAPNMKSFYLASRTHDGDTGINSSMIKYLQDAVNSLSQGVSPESALKTADSGFRQVFSRFGITSAQ